MLRIVVKSGALPIATLVALSGCVTSETGGVARGDARADYIECLTAYTLIRREQGRPVSRDEAARSEWCGVEQGRYHDFVVGRAYRVSGTSRIETADAALASVWAEVTGQGAS